MSVFSLRNAEERADGGGNQNHEQAIDGEDDVVKFERAAQKSGIGQREGIAAPDRGKRRRGSSSANPMVIIISGRGCEAKRRRKNRCMAKPMAPTTSMAASAPAQQAVRARHYGEGHVHAEHVEGAVGDVDDAHHAEYQREAAGDQKQERGREQAVEGLGDEVDHQLVPAEAT